MLSNEKQPILRALAHELADILADALVADLRADIMKRLPLQPLTKTGYQNAAFSEAPDLEKPVRPASPRTLWTLKELALDSGIKVSTWRRWILDRKIPVVRIGRAVRIKDDDYRKLIQKGYRKAI